MKILFILENHYPNIGGVETLFKSLTESLVSNGHQVTVLTNRISNTLAKEESINGVLIKRVSFYNRYLFTLFAFFPAFSLAMKNDVVHTTSYNAGLPAFFAAKLTGKKIIITFHEVWGDLWFKLPFMSKISLRLHYLFEWFLLKLPFTKFVAVSKFTSTSLINAGVNESKIETIYNGIDYSKVEPTKKLKTTQSFSFLYFGRLGVSKGLDLIIDALNLLKAETKKFNFTLVIPREPKQFHNWILEEIEKNVLQEFVNIKSELSREELNQIISYANCVVIPSWSEGFCFTAVETMALNIPIISSGRGALKEVISGKHITMEAMNPLALKTAFIKAMNEQWQETPIKRFELASSIESYEDLYSRILN